MRISIIEVEPKEGIMLKAIELESSMEHVSPCCTKYYRKFYCQNRIAEETWYHKVDASGDITYGKQINIIDDYVVNKEFDAILEIAERLNKETIEYYKTLKFIQL